MIKKTYYVEWESGIRKKTWCNKTKLETEEKMNAFVLNLAHEPTTVKIRTQIVTEITFQGGLTNSAPCVIIKIQRNRKEMKTMKEKIINILREHPGLRKREIASYLNCHHFTIITTLYEMEEDGLLRVESVHDTANMEFYDKYFVIGT